MTRSPEQVREAKRLHMARKRAESPEAMRAYHRERHHRNHEKNKAKLRDYYGRRFFWGRAMKLRTVGRATFRDLAAMWHRQRGLCALTGRRLDRSAQLDHIVPRAKGGDDSPKNLRWVSPEVNLAKRDLTDEQLFVLCQDVMHWIGKRIQMVEDLTHG